MSKRVAIAKAGTAAMAAVFALAASAPAMAQSTSGSAAYGGPGSSGYNYDPCRRDANQRGTAGALIGGGMGAVIGSNAAARNARTEGALLGGLLGAIAGGIVGNKTAACTSSTQAAYAPPPPPPAPSASGGYYQRDAYAAPAEAAREAREDAWAQPRTVAERPPEADNCTLAESPIFMPDGRTQSRFVRVCRDASGKYAVVD